MNNYRFKNLIDKDLFVFLGTDIPPICTRESFVIDSIKALIKKKDSNVLSFAEIFSGSTYSKKQQFSVISNLIKRKYLKVKKTFGNYYLFEIIPKDDFRKSSEVRIYRIKSKRERFAILKEFINK